MIRVMIVEDDVLFRQNIEGMLDWNALGFTLCASCIHGADALNRMEESAPDLVLTDISMPQMNGIELIRAIRQSYPLVRILVLSSYDDFDFVKEAMKLGADDYILKHELSGAMDQFLGILREIKGKLSFVSSDGLQAEESERQLLLDTLMMRVVNGSMTDAAKIESRLRRLMVFFPFDRYMTAVIYARKALAVMDISAEQCVPWAENGKFGRFHDRVLRLAQPASQTCMVFMLNDYTAVSLIRVAGVFSQSRLEAMVRTSLRDLLLEDFELCIGISRPVSGLSAVSKSYEQACCAAEDGFLYDVNVCSYYARIEKGCLPNEFVRLLDRLPELLDSRDSNRLNQWSAAFVQRVYTLRPCKPLFEQLCGQLNTILTKWASAHHLDMQNLIGFDALPSAAMAKSQNRTVMECYLNECFSHITAEILQVPLTSNLHIRKVLAYIGSHYNQPIGLRNISEDLELSENYLSNLFKQETGLRLVEYLNEVRLHHAIQMVTQTNLRVYEIAVACGFQSEAYFCRMFKEKTGISPIERRKQLT